MPSVALAPRAQLDIESIVLYTGIVCKQPAAAQQVSDAIYEAFDRLAEFPMLGEPFEHCELEKPYRRLLVESYWLYYEIDGEQIVVRRIFHQKQDIDDFALVDF